MECNIGKIAVQNDVYFLFDVITVALIRYANAQALSGFRGNSEIWINILSTLQNFIRHFDLEAPANLQRLLQVLMRRRERHLRRNTKNVCLQNRRLSAKQPRARSIFTSRRIPIIFPRHLQHKRRILSSTSSRGHTNTFSQHRRIHLPSNLMPSNQMRLLHLNHVRPQGDNYIIPSTVSSTQTKATSIDNPLMIPSVIRTSYNGSPGTSVVDTEIRDPVILLHQLSVSLHLMGSTVASDTQQIRSDSEGIFNSRPTVAVRTAPGPEPPAGPKSDLDSSTSSNPLIDNMDDPKEKET